MVHAFARSKKRNNLLIAFLFERLHAAQEKRHMMEVDRQWYDKYLSETNIERVQKSFQSIFRHKMKQFRV